MGHSSSPHPTPNPGRRLVYSLLSALIPGTGQLAAGYTRRGAIMLGVSLVLIVGIILVYLQGLSTLLSWVVQPRILITIFVVNVIVLLFRMGAVIDAYYSPRPDRGHEPDGWKQGLVTLALGVMLIVTAAPHAVLGYYTYLTHDTLTSVFSVEDLADLPTPTPVPATQAEQEPTPEPTSTPERSSNAPADSEPEVEPTSTPPLQPTPPSSPEQYRHDRWWMEWGHLPGSGELSGRPDKRTEEPAPEH